MKRFIDVAKGLALLSVFAFFASLTIIVWEGWNARTEVGKAVSARVDPVLKSVVTASGAVTKTATELPKQVTDVSNKVLAQTKDITTKADAQLTAMKETVDATVSKADVQATAIQATALKLGDKADPLLASYTKLGDEATRLVVTSNDAAKHVADALPPFTDCTYSDDAGNIVGGNPDCAFNRFQGVSKAVEKLAEEGAKAAPIIAKEAERTSTAVAGIAENGKKETDELMRKKTWKEQLKDYFELFSYAALRLF